VGIGRLGEPTKVIKTGAEDSAISQQSLAALVKECPARQRGKACDLRQRVDGPGNSYLPDRTDNSRRG
jgi:hypothetical protein